MQGRARLCSCVDHPVARSTGGKHLPTAHFCRCAQEQMPRPTHDYLEMHRGQLEQVCAHHNPLEEEAVHLPCVLGWQVVDPPGEVGDCAFHCVLAMLRDPSCHDVASLRRAVASRLRQANASAWDVCDAQTMGRPVGPLVVTEALVVLGARAALHVEEGGQWLLGDEDGPFLGTIVLRNGADAKGHYYGIRGGTPDHPRLEIAEDSSRLKCARDSEKRLRNAVEEAPPETLRAISRFTEDKRWLRGGGGGASRPDGDYFHQHAQTLEQSITSAVDEILQVQPRDPVVYCARSMAAQVWSPLQRMSSSGRLTHPTLCRHGVVPCRIRWRAPYSASKSMGTRRLGVRRMRRTRDAASLCPTTSFAGIRPSRSMPPPNGRIRASSTTIALKGATGGQTPRTWHALVSRRASRTPATVKASPCSLTTGRP